MLVASVLLIVCLNAVGLKARQANLLTSSTSAQTSTLVDLVAGFIDLSNAIWLSTDFLESLLGMVVVLLDLNRTVAAFACTFIVFSFFAR